MSKFFKFLFKLFVCGILFIVLEEVNPGGHGKLNMMWALIAVFGIPELYRRSKDNSDRKRWEREAEQRRIDKENAEEYAHQTALRRERERLEMHAELRIKELISTLEAQYMADAQKMQLLSKMKAEFANRQQTDLSSLLGRLEAMRAGA